MKWIVLHTNETVWLTADQMAKLISKKSTRQ